MVRIIYQHAVPWPEEGPLQVDARFRGGNPHLPGAGAAARQRLFGARSGAFRYGGGTTAYSG